MSLVEIWFEIWVNNNKITTLRIDSQALIPLNLHHWTYLIISNYHIICIIWYTSWIDVPYFIHCHMDLQIDLVTLPATNIAPENGWLEYQFPFGMAYFQVRTVSFRECTYIYLVSWISFDKATSSWTRVQLLATIPQIPGSAPFARTARSCSAPPLRW